MTLFVFILTQALATSAIAGPVDCSEAYRTPAKCERIKCDEKFQSFLGTWSGPMETLVDFGATPVYRQYQNRVTYDSADCLKNLENGDQFIIGRQTDTFPASHGLASKIEKKLLITGRDRGDRPFLRTVDLSTGEDQSYQLVHKNDVAVLSIWRISGTEKGQPYTVETIDAQDWTVADPSREHRRNVTVTLESGGFTRVLVRGYHTKHP